MSTLGAVLNARPKDPVIAAPGVYDMVSLRMAAAWRHHRLDRQCNKYPYVTVSLFSLAGAHRAMSAGTQMPGAA
jgi:hypothetical protein